MTNCFQILDSGLITFPYHDTMVKPQYGDLVDCPSQTMGRNYNLAFCQNLLLDKYGVGSTRLSKGTWIGARYV